MASGYCNRDEPEPQPLQAPGFIQKPSCHLLFETSMSTEQLCCDREGTRPGTGSWPGASRTVTPSHSQAVLAPHELLQCLCAPQPIRALLTTSQPPPHSCCIPPDVHCSWQSDYSYMFKCQMCLLLRDRTNADHSLYLVPRTH